MSLLNVVALTLYQVLWTSQESGRTQHYHGEETSTVNGDYRPISYIIFNASIFFFNWWFFVVLFDIFEYMIATNRRRNVLVKRCNKMGNFCRRELVSVIQWFSETIVFLSRMCNRTRERVRELCSIFRWNFQRKCRLLHLLQGFHHQQLWQRHFIIVLFDILEMNRRYRSTIYREIPTDRGPKIAYRYLRILFGLSASENARLEVNNRRYLVGYQDARLQRSVFVGKKIMTIKQSHRSWRMIGGLERPSEDALAIEPMRPLPQNAVSCWPTTLIDDVGILDKEGTVLMSRWSLSSPVRPRSVDISSWPACEPEYCWSTVKKYWLSHNLAFSR